MYRIRKKRNGTIERVNLVKHQLFFMDDILILGTNAKDIHKAMKLIIQKADEMGLKIKDSWMVYTTIAKRKDDGHLIDIMGVRIYRQHITIRRRVFLRVRRSYKKAQSLVKQRKKIPIWLARKCMSYKASGFDKYYVDHTLALWPQAASGTPWTATYFQSKGDPITDLHEDMAADGTIV